MLLYACVHASTHLHVQVLPEVNTGCLLSSLSLVSETESFSLNLGLSQGPSVTGVSTLHPAFLSVLGIQAQAVMFAPHIL